MIARPGILAIAAVVLSTGCSPEPRTAYVGEPRQRNMPSVYTDPDGIKKIAQFDADVLVLARKDYWRTKSDPLSQFSQTDIAVAWGEGALAEVHGPIRISQGNRFYFWRAGGEAWQDPRVRRFGRHSANWHLIPANDDVASVIDDISSGDVVTLRGHLVNLHAKNGQVMRTSLTRNDSGAGACEIILVSEATIRPE